MKLKVSVVAGHDPILGWVFDSCVHGMENCGKTPSETAEQYLSEAYGIAISKRWVIETEIDDLELVEEVVLHGEVVQNT